MTATSLGFGAVAMEAPASLVPASVSTFVALAGIGSICLGILLWLQEGLADTSCTDELDRATRPAADPAHEWRGDRVGWRVDAELAADPGEGRVSPYRIRRELRRTLETTLVERGDRPPDRATERLRAGTWTDDPRAATCLGETDVRPWSLRVRDWLTGDAFSRNLRAAAAEIDRLATDLDRAERPGPVLDRRRDGSGARGPDAAAASRDTAGSALDGPPGSGARRLDDAIDEHARTGNVAEATDPGVNDGLSTDLDAGEPPDGVRR